MAKAKTPQATPKKAKAKQTSKPTITGGGDGARENPRKLAFARKFVELGQAMPAYYAAGYTGAADKHAYDLLKDRVVREEIERLYSALELDTLVTTRYVIANIRRAADITGQVRFSPVLGTLDMLDVSAHLRANEMLGKYLGIFREKVEVSGSLAQILDEAPDPTPGAKAA